MIRDVPINTNTPNVIDKSFVSEQAEKKKCEKESQKKVWQARKD